MSLSRRALLWLVPFFFTLHNLEEGFGIPTALAGIASKLPAWVARLLPAGAFPPTFRQFVVMLIIVTALPYGFALLGGSKRPRGLRTLLLAGVQTLMLINVFSHVVLMNVQNSYVPGLVTALIFNLPFSLFFLGSGLRQGWLQWRDFYYLVPLALLAHGPGLFGLYTLSAQILH